MGNPRNPDNNAIIQALLDAADCGLGEYSINDAIVRLRNDSQMRTALKHKWNAHTYPEKAMEWAQLTMTQQLMSLSDTALKVLIFLGMYAHQSTLVQISYKDMSILTGIKLTQLRQAIKELIGAGCLRVDAPSVRHSAPIYAVNSAIINKGKRHNRKGSTAGFATDPDRYLLKREPEMLVQQETVFRLGPGDTKTPYNRLRPISKEEAAMLEDAKKISIFDFME